MESLFTYFRKPDVYFFEKINSDWTNGFLDSVFPWWRDQNTWIPLYLFLFLFMIFNFGKKAWSWIVLVVVCVTITDQLSSHLLKLWIQKPRPCQDVELLGHVRLLIGGCPVNPGFPSSHACNHFGAAFFLFLTLKPLFKSWSYLFFFWAATISYAQVYIGVHFPLDVIGGAIIGTCIGIALAFIYNRFIGLPTSNNSVSI